MSVQTDFEKEFETEEYEMLILVQASCGGAACIKDMLIKDMLKPSVDFLASIDLRNGQFFHEKGRVEWLIKKDNKRKGWGYDFEQFGIYRVVVRKCIPQKLQPYQLHYMNNRYMLIRVLEENASNEKLEALKEHYSKPISTENELGTFVLEREFSWFEGSINWNGVEANVYLETDEEDGDTAEQAMAVLKSVIENIVDNDNKYREFAAQELTGLANEWLSESDESDVEEITQETFAKRMEISEVTVSPDGSLSLIYHDDDMFWGHEGYGAQRIATYLNNAGYRARSGKCWHPGSLRGMVGNLTYMGVLRCGDARSELMPELQIIPQEEFEAAQRIREDRSAHAAEEAEHHVPLRTRGQALLSNNVYCGHCGARLALTTSRKWRKLSDGTLDDTLRIRYTCYGKLRKQTDCTGQTGYTMHILDEIIDKMVRQIFSRLRGVPKEQLITSRYAKETAERKNHLQALQAERDKAEKDLLALKAEILAVIKGESAFPKDTLAEMIAAQEKKHTELETLCEEASAELERNAELMANVSQLYEELISFADLYDSASFEAKKMIVSQLIRRVDVYRGYQIHVDFNFDLAQYLENSDELAC